MAYSTYAEIFDLTATLKTQTVIEALIAQADRYIDGMLEPYGLTGNATGSIKTASICLTQALLADLDRRDGTRSGTITTGPFTQSDSIDAEIAGQKKMAKDMIDAFIKAGTQTEGGDNQSDYIYITNS